jgi:hypothetical protein
MKNKKLSEEQLTRITSIQQNYQSLSRELGSIELSKISIEGRRKAAEDYLDTLQQQEREIAEELEKEFGKGSVNLELGEYITLAEPVE